MTKRISIKHRKHLFAIDYLDEMLQEKITLDCVGKSDSTVCTNILFPSIQRPTEVPWTELQSRGLEIRHFQGSTSLCCFTFNKISVLQRNKDQLPLFVFQVQRSKSAKPFTAGD